MRCLRVVAAVLSAVAVAIVPARAEAQALPVVGWVHVGTPDGQKRAFDGFIAGLKEGGYIDGRNVAVKVRWANEDYARLPGLFAEMVEANAAVIVSGGGSQTALIAKSATTKTPIVFLAGVDPIAAGLVTNISRPGGNVTGVAILLGEMAAKQIELLDQIVPKGAALAALLNPSNRLALATETNSLRAAAEALDRPFVAFPMSNAQEFADAFAEMSRQRVGGVVLGAEALFSHNEARLAALALEHRIPASRFHRGFPEAGGLLSYGPDLAGAYRQCGAYAARILDGASPGNLPVHEMAKVELVVNLKTARALGIEMPAALLARADEVIE